MRRAPNSPSPSKANRWKSGSGRWRRKSARKSSAIAMSPTPRRWMRSSKKSRGVGDNLDFVVHCVAFSDKDQLTGRYIDTTADNFTNSLLVSCYSFTAVAQRAEKLMHSGGSMLTLTYYGAEKWMPHYNVMGVAKAALESSVRYLAADLGERNIRVNAISAGPIKTLAASGIGDFRYILKWNEYNAPVAPHGHASKRSAKARLFCFRPWRAALPAKSCMSTAAIMSSA